MSSKYRVGVCSLVCALVVWGLNAGISPTNASASADDRMASLSLALPPEAPSAPEVAYAKTITVTTVADLTTSMSETCIASPPAQCTLRRAIVEARAASSGQRPLLIAFNLPAAESDNPPSPHFWTIKITETASSDLRDLAGGQITLDGSTQPGGRSSSPKVILHGSAVADRLIVNDGFNTIRGIAFQYLSVLFNASDNVFENNWMGLTSDGQSVFVINNNPSADPRANVGEAEASRRNIYRNSTITGSRTNAITLRGQSGLAQSNQIGTRGDGTVPTIDPARWCKANARFNNWFGGAGIVAYNGFNVIESNRIAGLLSASDDPLNTPLTAITLEDGDNIVRNNVIGVDSAGKPVGTCGNGIVLTDARNQVLANRIVRAGITNGDTVIAPPGQEADTGAIGLRGSTLITQSLGNNLMRGNIISQSVEAIYFYPSVADGYAYFNPAKITSIVSRTVIGAAGDPGQPPAPGLPVNSACNGCVVELFLDTLDDHDDALQSLGVITATNTGAFTFTLAAPLQANQGIRTSSTTVAVNQIQGFPAGTTTRLSLRMYTPYGPMDNTAPPAVTPQTPPAYPTLAPRAIPAFPSPVYKTVITVTKTSDPSTSLSQTCYTTPGTGQTAYPGECTLRRAVVEARTVPAAARPVLISFKIPTTDTGYLAAQQAWQINLTNNSTLRNLEGGDISIDGHTQRTNIGGRTTGPTIMISGTASTQILVVDDDRNLLRGLGLMGFGIVLNDGDNFVEANWLGLTPDGLNVYFHNGNKTAENDATVQDASASFRNVIRNNRIAGSRASAITLRGEDSWVVGNYIGTRADGTIPAPPDPNNPCAFAPGSGNWLGGWGIQVFGKRHQIGGPNAADRNIIAGLLIESADPNTTQGIALQLGSVGDFLVQNNYIGRDALGADAGTCGEGIRNSSEFSTLRDNVIFTRRAAAINHLQDIIGGNGNTYRGNLILNSASPIVFGPTVPNALAYFNPGRVTSILGTAVQGTNGIPGFPPGNLPPIDSTCPFCLIEVFLEDRDGVTESLQSLGVATSTVTGDWTFTLPAALTSTQGLRTISTSRNYGTIAQYEAGTSTRLSRLYADGGVASVGPVTPPPAQIAKGKSVTITVTTGFSFLGKLPDVTASVDYVWSATSLAPPADIGGGTTSTRVLNWASLTGEKRVRVVASNFGGEAMWETTIQVGGLKAYLPFVSR